MQVLRQKVREFDLQSDSVLVTLCSRPSYPTTLSRANDANGGNQHQQLVQPTNDANGGGSGGEAPSSFASMMFSKDAPKIEPRILNLIPLKPDHPPTPPMMAKGTPPRGKDYLH